MSGRQVVLAGQPAIFDRAKQNSRFQVCFAYDILGIAMCLLLLDMSAIRKGERFKVGPRIFVVNLMLVNLAHASCGLVIHGGMIFPQMRGNDGCE